MTRYDYPDSATATLAPFSEATLAEQLSREGGSIRESRGRYWRRLKTGFYAPVHWLARYSLQEAQRPGACWGFVAGLDEGSAGEANATIPMHVIADLQAYGPKNVPKTTRRSRRRLDERGIRIVHVTDERLLHDQGHAVMCEWRARKDLPLPGREAYVAQARRRLESGAWLALAALDGDELLGYTWVWAVDHAAYLHEYAVRTAAMSAGLRLSAVLNYEAVSVLQRTASISEVTAGQVQAEEPGALAYKLEQGYPIKQIPARLRMPWPVARFLRATRPYAYQRLTGTADRGASSTG